MKLIKRIKCAVCNFKKIWSIYKLSYGDLEIKNFLEVYYNKKLNLDLITSNDYNLLEWSFIFNYKRSIIKQPTLAISYIAPCITIGYNHTMHPPLHTCC